MLGFRLSLILSPEMSHCGPATGRCGEGSYKVKIRERGPGPTFICISPPYTGLEEDKISSLDFKILFLPCLVVHLYKDENGCLFFF